MVLDQEKNQNFMSMSGSAQIEFAIKSETENINSLYMKLGKLYLSIHPSDYEQALTEAVEAIKASEANIKRYEQQLEELNAVIKCPTCGTELPKSAAFCINCGTQMSMPAEPKPEEDQNAVKCPACGQAVEDGMKFCTFCGYSLSVQIAPVVPLEEVAPVVPLEEVAPVEDSIAQESVAPNLEVEQAVVNTTVCTTCGQALESDMKFCTFCGAAINKLPEAAPMEELATEPAPVVSVTEASKANAFTCSACGQSVEEGSKFCVYCGTATVAPVFASANLAEPKCPTCGAIVSKGSAFCVECGTKL